MDNVSLRFLLLALFYLICISNMRTRSSTSGGRQRGQQKTYFCASFVQLHAFTMLFKWPKM